MADFSEAWYSDLLATAADGLSEAVEGSSGSGGELGSHVERLLDIIRRDLQYGLRYTGLIDYVCCLNENDVKELIAQVRKVSTSKFSASYHSKFTNRTVLPSTDSAHLRISKVLIKSSLVFENPLEELQMLLRCLRDKFGRVPLPVQKELIRALLVVPQGVKKPRCRPVATVGQPNRS